MAERTEHDVDVDSRQWGVRALPHVCWLFLGLGVYRAWIEVAFVGSFVAYPQAYDTRALFDLTCAAVLFGCAVASRRAAPLFCHARASWAMAGTMALSAALGFATLLAPELAGTLAPFAAVLGGAAVAGVILLWSELYGCLTPVRIALYYGLSQLVGAAIVWTLKGFAQPWLAIYTCLLPLASVAMARAAFKTLPPERLPHPSGARFSFPWKPVVLVCAYAFAFGLQEANTYAVTGPHSGFGMMAASAIVVCAILFLGARVGFGTVYSVWLPALMMVSLVLSLVGSLGAFGASFFVSLSYGASEIFVMTMIGSICYRYGVNAVWIFGIERGVRMLAMALGRAADGFAHGWPVVGAVIIAVVVGTWLIFSERAVSSDWGIVLHDEGDGPYRTSAQNALGRKCAELGRTHGLTEREEEVLLLLAQRKTAGDIERELCVAYGTAKAHIRHVYRKLDIHSRDELFALVGVATQ